MSEKFDPQTAELELKYEITEDQFRNPEKVTKAIGPQFNKPMEIIGVDKFFKINEKFFRIRGDKMILKEDFGGSLSAANTYTITVKERISDSSLTHRKEVDLNCQPGDRPVEFFKMLGAEEVFSISKRYHVWTQKHNGSMPTIMVATYMVSDPSGNNKRYFLEIEVEKDGDWTLDQRLERLTKSSLIIENDLNLGKPVNLSLFEIYKPK